MLHCPAVAFTAYFAHRLFGAGGFSACMRAVVIALRADAVFPGVFFGGNQYGSALAESGVGILRSPVICGFKIVIIRVGFSVMVAAFFANRGLHTVCLSAGMLAAVLTHPANSVFIVIVRFGNTHIAAGPVLLVTKRRFFVISRPWLCMVIRVFFAVIFFAD